MTEIFFSYSSRDRDRVLPLRDALIGCGFAVFWDQEVPTGTDWETWIRRNLTESKCAIVLKRKIDILDGELVAERRQLGDAEGRSQRLLQQETDTRRVIAKLEETVSELEKTRDEVLAQAAERGRDAGVRAMELTNSLRDAYAKIAALESQRATLDSPPPEARAGAHLRSRSSLSARSLNESGAAAPDVATMNVEAHLLPGIVNLPSQPSAPIGSGNTVGTVVQRPFTAGDVQPGIIRLRVGAVGIGIAITLTIWAVAFQRYYPSDFLIKYNYLVAFVTLVAGLALVHGVTLLTATRLVVTWSILGSALTLVAAASLFKLYYPNDNLIVRNYFLSAGEIGVWWLLARTWETAEPPRKRQLNDEVPSRRLTRTGPDGAE